MQLFIFGNPDLAMDSLPIKLIPELEKRFPEHVFTVLDPNEEWNVPKDMYIIDTVVGIDTITTFTDLSVFLDSPKVTCHDFDAYTNLQFLKKLGKIETVSILGIPQNIQKGEIFSEIRNFIETKK